MYRPQQAEAAAWGDRVQRSWQGGASRESLLTSFCSTSPIHEELSSTFGPIIDSEFLSVTLIFSPK